MAYNDKIIIQQGTESRGSAGGVETVWTTYKTVWAEIDDTSGNESEQADMPVFTNSVAFKIRTIDAPAVTSKMRVSWISEYFYIRSIHKEGRLRTVIMADAYDDE